MTDFFKTLDYLRRNQVVLQKFIFLCWTIWKERNALIFSNTNVSPCRCYFKAFNTFKEWEFRLLIDSHQLRGTPFTTPPSPANLEVVMQIHFDGSCKSTLAAGGIIIRDSNGKTIAAKSYNFGKSQVYMAEALALHKGIQEAISLGVKDIHIEGDNLLVINSLKGTWNPPLKLQNIIQDSKTLQTVIT
ncbi:uncharacterized protein [Spinacia oleracea]|uniref:RNase H type-1 domain-containing protein n=1 Tax=Spinacia oleracea TaxID=3562 RepID=A0ABM3R4E3_SPIOL|nr:uncharacterized protein LOC130465656 [Spinacia oleracea]